MSCETAPKYRITTRAKDIREIGHSLAPEYRESFFTTMGTYEFGKEFVAIAETGEVISMCRDVDRLKRCMDRDGWEEDERI